MRCTLSFRRPPQVWRYTGILERSVPHVDLFLSPSSFTIEAHRARGFTGAMRRLPLFLPESEIGQDEETNGGRPYFLFVGRLEPLKGVHVLVELFRSYRDADLLVVGDGTSSASLRRGAEGLDHVHFLGSVYGARLDALYRGATALLVPSVGYETFGMVIVEAMARGTPSIVHDLGALPEVIEDSGGAGIAYRTTDELLDAMRRIRADPSYRGELGERGRAAWEARWSEEPHVEGYFEAIDEARGAA
jgi:glycosyltransferase involved in cell wall biosynthesis